jgi:putative ABC transport system ATP-binding protein
MVYGRSGTEERKERALELLKNVGLEDRAHHMPNELSGGQKQRVAIARALANKPQIILADEPTGNLDSQSSVESWTSLHANRQQGNTVIIVTHEREIAEFTNRIITFKDGCIIKDEIVREVGKC